MSGSPLAVTESSARCMVASPATTGSARQASALFAVRAFSQGVTDMPNSRIRTLKFITHFGIGGTERQFVYIARGLDRTRFDVEIACMGRKGAFLPEAEAIGSPIAEYKANSLYMPSTF